MSKLRIYIAIALGVLLAPQALCENYPIRGRVIDRLTRRGVAYAAVVIVGQGTKGASADAEGEFVIEGVAPGIYRLEASMLGYRTTVTPDIWSRRPRHSSRSRWTRRVRVSMP